MESSFITVSYILTTCKFGKQAEFIRILTIRQPSRQVMSPCDTSRHFQCMLACIPSCRAHRLSLPIMGNLCSAPISWDSEEPINGNGRSNEKELGSREGTASTMLVRLTYMQCNTPPTNCSRKADLLTFSNSCSSQYTLYSLVR